MSIAVGTSHLLGRTFGKTQFMSNVQAGMNLRAALFELARDHDIIVTVNEADRPRPDQWQLYLDMPRTGILAAYCKPGPHPYEYTRGTWTSTHDPINYGNGADLGMGDGGVITDRARNLLDANHPDGVIGRKWGLFNTGWNFRKRERWHFNIFPARAQRLATQADYSDKAEPPAAPKRRRNEDDMQVAWNDKHTQALIVAGAKHTTIDASTPTRGGIQWQKQVTLCERFAAIDPSTPYPGGLNNTELAVLRQIINGMKDS